MISNYKVKINDSCNYKVNITDIQNKYKFKLFCAGADLTDYYTKEQVDSSQAVQDTLINNLLNQIPAGTATGKTINVTDSSDLPLKDIQMSGNTYQETTTGKNLLDTSTVEIGTKNGITTTYNSATQEITFNGTCNTDNTQIVVSTNTITFVNGTTKVIGYYVSGSLTNSGVFRTFSSNWANYDGVNIYQLNSSNPIIVKTTTFNADKNLFSFRFDNGAVATNFTIKLMITDSNDTTFEKFTYGASPNPDYPQNIDVVTGENDITICGKNIFNGETEIGGWNFTEGEQLTKATTSHQLRCTNKIRVAPNTNYIFSLNGNAVTETVRFIFADKNNIILSSTTNSDGTILTPNNCEYLAFHSSAFKTTYGSTLPNPMIEVGSTATTYEAYTGTTYPINLGNIELCKISTYQDYIYKSNGNWYKKNNIGKVVLNGSEEWTLTNNVLQSTNEMPSDIRAIGATMSAYSSHFEYHYYATSITTNIQSGEFGWNSGKKLTFKIDGFTTKQEYTNWLGNNNVSIYYQLSTSTDTQITDSTLVSQLNALYNSTTYKTTTNITITTTNEKPTLTVTYRKDLETLIGG